MKNNQSHAGNPKAEAEKKSPIIGDFLKTISPATRRAVRKKMGIALQIEEAMRERGWTQKEFALRLGKRESEISKWLSGKQNFTLESLCLIEEALGCDVFQVPRSFQAISQRMLDNLAAMQREAALWKMTMPIGVFAQKAVSPNAISMDHFSVQALNVYESSSK